MNSHRFLNRLTFLLALIFAVAVPAKPILQSPKGRELFPTLGIPLVVQGVRMTIVLSNAVNSVTLAWNPSVSTNVDGYYVYWGTVSRFSATNYHYPFKTDSAVTNKLGQRLIRTNATITVPQGVKHYFAATAYSTNSLESDYSNETNYTLPFSYNTVTLNWTPAATNTVMTSTNLKTWTVLTNAYPPVTIPRIRTTEFYRLRIP